MAVKSINAELRSETKKNNCNRIRSDGFIPAVIYSHGKSESLKISKKDFFKLFKGNISESVIFDINITNKKDDSEMMAFVKDYQYNPVTGEIIHLDLFKVTKGEKIQTQVHIEISGSPKGVKLGGILEVENREIFIECLPMDLPEKISLNVNDLDIGQTIHAKDLNLGASVKLLSNPDAVICGVHLAKVVEEPVAEAAVEAPGQEPAAAEGKTEGKSEGKSEGKKE